MSGTKSSFEDLLAQIRDNYFRELPEKFDEMESLTLELIQGGGNEVFEALFRTTHSMKGSAGTYGLDSFTTICHNLEDCFYEYQEANGQYPSEKLRGWLAYVDLLRRAYILLQDNMSDFKLIENELDALRHREKSYQYRGLIIAEKDLDIVLMQKTFAQYPVDFSLAHDGLEGLERLLTERFDFYICNNQLPRLNGVSIVSAIKQSPGLNRETVAVLITSAMHTRHGHKEDPEHVVHKDSRFIHRLESLAADLILQMQSK